MDGAPPVGDAETALASGEIPCCVSLCLGVADTAVEGPLAKAPLDTGDPGPLPVGEAAALSEVCVSGRAPGPWDPEAGLAPVCVGSEPPDDRVPEGPNVIPDDVAGKGITIGVVEEPPCDGDAVGVITTGGMPPLDDPGLGTIEGPFSPVEVGSSVGITGTLVVKVVCALVTVVSEDEIGATSLLPAAIALEIAPAGLLMGTSVVKVVCELAIVTGADMTGTAPLETPANAVDMAPAGLLIGTLAVKVASG